MPRQKENKKLIQIRVSPEHYELLKQMVLEQGFVYNHDSEELPGWSSFAEAIASGDLLVYKKVSPNS